MGSFSGFWRTLKVLWTWGDQLAPFFEALPRNLAVAGDAMVIGGEGALRAGQAFNGAAATSVQQMLEAVAAAVASCNRELDAVAGQLESAGNFLNQVAIPVIEPTTTKILGIDVVTGLKPTTMRPFGSVDHELEAAAGSLRDAGRALDTSATHLRGLRSALQGAGQDLDHLGRALQDSGQALQRSGD
ncbi:MAG: hypothetical protein WAV74_00380 [Anaerolineae bacterium]